MERRKPMQVTTLPLSSVEAMFQGPVVLEVPSFTNRYSYKKEDGSSDTHTQKDEFE
jgi:hypothetical protein